MPQAKSGERLLIAFIAKQHIFKVTETHSCMRMCQVQHTLMLRWVGKKILLTNYGRVLESENTMK